MNGTVFVRNYKRMPQVTDWDMMFVIVFPANL
ncbi:hypothetical protein ZEAMMB73_Zm00001d019310 [Zea mays]|uniref:Uncharacterized protein n=1 Tax=Zea mays TaxID=4577 RepID=A0A1D6HWR4_MAIZE|nr:hypothetical protein ZEAMMB73_Zm00001d019310 [Zea mays]